MISKNDAPLPAEAEPEEALSSVARAARLVLEIVPGERRLLPDFGCRAHEIESFAAPASRALAAALVEEALERWAPGIRVDRAEISAPEDGVIGVRLRAGGAWHELAVKHRRDEARARREAAAP